MNIKLLNNHILVKPVEQESKAGSFYLPDTASKDRKRVAEVVAVGPGRMNDEGERLELEVKAGDKVMYKHSEYGSEEIEIEKEKYVLIEEPDVLMIL